MGFESDKAHLHQSHTLAHPCSLCLHFFSKKRGEPRRTSHGRKKNGAILERGVCLCPLQRMRPCAGVVLDLLESHRRMISFNPWCPASSTAADEQTPRVHEKRSEEATAVRTEGIIAPPCVYAAPLAYTPLEGFIPVLLRRMGGPGARQGTIAQNYV